MKSKTEALQAALSSLPHQVVNEAQLSISEEEGSATYKQKLDVVKEQEEMIADELEEESVLFYFSNNFQIHEEADKKEAEKKKQVAEKEGERKEAGKGEATKQEPPTEAKEEVVATPHIPAQMKEMIEAKSPLDSEFTSKMIKEVQKEDVEGTLSEEELKVCSV